MSGVSECPRCGARLALQPAAIAQRIAFCKVPALKAAVGMLLALTIFVGAYVIGQPFLVLIIGPVLYGLHARLLTIAAGLKMRADAAQWLARRLGQLMKAAG